MIRLPGFLATPLRLILGIVTVIAFGAGVYYAWRWKRDRDALAEVNAVPEIAAARVLVTERKQDVSSRKIAYRGAVTDFNTDRDRARADPNTPASTAACFEKGAGVISKCDALQLSFDSLVAAQDTLAVKLTDDAVRARRGKLLALTAAVGYEPILGAPVGRLGVGLNFSDHWSLIGTHDQAVKFRKDSTGKIRTTFYPSAFVGLQYQFGGRR